MDQIVISLISGVVGAMVGGTMTVLGSKKVLTTSMANLERAEIRKLKVECLSNLIGLRFVTPAPTDQLPEYVSKWMFEMNRICVLWSDDPCVMKDLRDFNAEPSNIARLTKLFRTMGKTTTFHLDNLSDTDLGALFLMQIKSTSLSVSVTRPC
jgi:hypothetical protein